jgi:hypothetical protein
MCKQTIAMEEAIALVQAYMVVQTTLKKLVLL